jgi:hypothetical protein
MVLAKPAVHKLHQHCLNTFQIHVSDGFPTLLNIVPVVLPILLPHPFDNLGVFIDPPICQSLYRTPPFDRDEHLS